MLLGIDFDSKHLMHTCVRSTATSAGWKVTALLRTQRYYNAANLVGLYKTHVLSFIEYRTPGLAHAATSVIAPLGTVQERFLKQNGGSELDAAT